RVRAAKIALLELLRDALQPAFIVHPDSPIDERVNASWEEQGERGWRIPADLDFNAAATEYWLFALGNWLAFGGAVGLPSIDDPFDAPPRELLADLRKAGVTLFLCSFH